MKILSEKTNKEYASVEECLAAEEEFDKQVAAEKAKKDELATARKARAIEVEAAFKASVEATKHYRDLLNKFVADYGSFHMTLHSGDYNPFDGFDHFFRGFWL